MLLLPTACQYCDILFAADNALAAIRTLANRPASLNPPVACMTDPHPSTSSTRKIFRLSAVTTRIRDLLLDATKAQFWVKALFVPDKGRGTGGHCYGNFVEQDDNGTQVAKLRAVIWKADLQRIERAFSEHGLENALRDSMEVCALCGVRFHPVHGLTLNIFEIDPTAGESRVERNRREILEQLEREGLLRLNRELTLAAVPLRIGLITAPNSAALADFTHTLQVSPFAFKVVLATAAMQGEDTARSIIQALRDLSTVPLDMICILRGGGSPLDLAWLDDLSIGRAVASCPIPVWVGIGHEIDVGILDHLAHTSHKTPTAVAKVLVERLQVLDERLLSDTERLREICDRRALLASRDVSRFEEGLIQGSRKHLEIGLGQLLRATAELESSLTGHRADQESRFRQRWTQLQERTRRIAEQKQATLLNASQMLTREATDRIQMGAADLDRNVQGLVAGGRKQQELFAERHRRRYGHLTTLVLQKVRDRLTRVATTGNRLQQLADVRLSRNETGVDQVSHRARLTLELRLRSKEHELSLEPRRVKTAGRAVDESARNLTEKHRRLEALDPVRLLGRGYSVTRTSDGRVVKSPADVGPGETIHTQLHDGTLVSRVITDPEERQ